MSKRLQSIFSKVITNTRKLESEKETEKYLTKRMNEIGGQSYKWSSPQNRGVPDRICLFPTMEIIFVEVKSEREKPSKIQLIVHRKLERIVQKVWTVDTKQEVDAFINQIVNS